MFAEGDSGSCLHRGTCEPLGGHSVWAAMPPFPADQPTSDLPLTLVLAQTDGIGLFHDLIKVKVFSSRSNLGKLFGEVATVHVLLAVITSTPA